MPYELRLFQINLGKRRAASYDLVLRTRDLDLFIVLAQEQWMVGGRVKWKEVRKEPLRAP